MLALSLSSSVYMRGEEKTNKSYTYMARPGSSHVTTKKRGFEKKINILTDEFFIEKKLIKIYNND